MQPNFDNLIVGMIFLGLTLIFMRSVLNAAYPNLFGMTMRLLKTLALYLIEFVVWVVKMVLSLFNIDLDKKELPRRRK